ncbi:MAG: XisI protein [Gemmataceae bacterium]
MDTLTRYREIVEHALCAHADTPPSTGNIEYQLVFDRNRDHYLLISVGWGNQRRVYGTVAHVDIVGDKVWIQHDGTEEGLASTLHENGIPAEHIVLGYRIPEVRKHTGSAVA